MSIDDSSANTYQVTEQIGHLLRKAYQRHTAIFQQNACDAQLTSIQFVTLCAPVSYTHLTLPTKG